MDIRSMFYPGHFIYYGFTALSYVAALWAFHLIHHSSPYMNLTTLSPQLAERIDQPVLFLPLALAGFPRSTSPSVMHLTYCTSFLCIQKPSGNGQAGGIIDSPSAHRGAHGKNRSISTKISAHTDDLGQALQDLSAGNRKIPLWHYHWFYWQ